jgi:hypothetical protein
MRVYGELVTPNFFTLLGVRPAAGRDFREDEGRVPGREAGGHRLARVLDPALHADPAAVGRTMTINTQPFTIVGVMPPGFYGSVAGLALDLFMPMTMQKTVISGDRLGDRGTSWLQVYGRLQPGATFDRAQAGLSVAGARLASAYPSDNEGRSLRAGTLSQDGASDCSCP